MTEPTEPIRAIIDLTTAQEHLSEAVRSLVLWVRSLLWLVAACIMAVLLFGTVHVWLGQVIRDEGAAGRQSFKCVIAVLFRQDPPSCPQAKENLIREGIIPANFPSTTTTTVP